MSTINTTSDWGDQYDNQDVTLDGTSSPITVTVKAVHYDGWTEGDSSNTNFHSNNMTVDGNVTLKGDGYLTVNNTVTNNSSLTIEAKNFTIDGTLTGKNVTIANGGALTVGTLTAPITFGASPSGETEYNTLTVKNYAASGTLTLNNLSPRDKIIFDNGQSTTLQWGDDGKTIVDQNGTVLANVTFAEGYDKDDYQFNGDVVTVTCFLSGSMIRTCNGDVAVEDLRIGDQIVAFDWKNKKDVLRPVVWVGKARATVRPALHDDEAGYPVRILKDAVSDGVPYKDMLITAEHCLFFKGKFVPVRMLVNGASIFYDKSITSYDYYHVETEQHSVITADGMLTESYLDTGNRSSFRQEGRVVALHGTARTWEKDAGAPLCVDRAFVEPLFRMLEWREDSVAGCQTSANAPALTQDPDLHLVTETDAVIRPMRKAAHHYSFMLPPGTQSVRIVSRTSRPADVTGPFVDDRRSMGVAVADIHLFCAKSQHDISAHRQAVKPAGWYPSDDAQCVWTNGDAELPLGDYLTEGKMGILSLQILAAGPYIIRAEETAETQVKTA